MEQARTRLHAARAAAGRTYTVRMSGTSGLPDALARVSAALEGAQFALVFGSFGTPSFGPESDLDVAVSFSRALPPIALVSLAGRFSSPSRAPWRNSRSE